MSSFPYQYKSSVDEPGTTSHKRGFICGKSGIDGTGLRFALDGKRPSDPDGNLGETDAVFDFDVLRLILVFGRFGHATRDFSQVVELFRGSHVV
jgi:hypothetical protein